MEHGEEEQAHRRYPDGDDGVAGPGVGGPQHEPRQQCGPRPQDPDGPPVAVAQAEQSVVIAGVLVATTAGSGAEIGRASCRERV